MGAPPRPDGFLPSRPKLPLGHGCPIPASWPSKPALAAEPPGREASDPSRPCLRLRPGSVLSPATDDFVRGPTRSPQSWTSCPDGFVPARPRLPSQQSPSFMPVSPGCPPDPSRPRLLQTPFPASLHGCPRPQRPQSFTSAIPPKALFRSRLRLPTKPSRFFSVSLGYQLTPNGVIPGLFILVPAVMLHPSDSSSGPRLCPVLNGLDGFIHGGPRLQLQAPDVGRLLHGRPHQKYSGLSRLFAPGAPALVPETEWYLLVSDSGVCPGFIPAFWPRTLQPGPTLSVPA